MAKSKPKHRAEPDMVIDGKRVDKPLWDEILGDDAAPWDTTIEESITLASRKTIDNGRKRP